MTRTAARSADAPAPAATDPATNPATDPATKPGRVGTSDNPRTAAGQTSPATTDATADPVVGAIGSGSVEPVELVPDASGPAPRPEADRPAEFTVRPARPVYGFVAGGSALLALLFGIAARSVGGGFESGWRWVVAGGFGVLALAAAWTLRSKPLLVADRTGIRLRIRSEWIGAPWEEIEAVTVLPRRHVLDDGRIAIHLDDPGPVVAAMDAATRKVTDANRRLTGSSLAVPFGLAATPSDPAVIAALTALADDRCPVTEQP
jgi:hypothetical protein